LNGNPEVRGNKPLTTINKQVIFFDSLYDLPNLVTISEMKIQIIQKKDKWDYKEK
jgi:hypothetical protein